MRHNTDASQDQAERISLPESSMRHVDQKRVKTEGDAVQELSSHRAFPIQPTSSVSANSAPTYGSVVASTSASGIVSVSQYCNTEAPVAMIASPFSVTDNVEMRKSIVPRSAEPLIIVPGDRVPTVGAEVCTYKFNRIAILEQKRGSGAAF